MPRKNLLSLHEAIVVALINQPTRTSSFEDIAKFIEERDLYTEREGNIPLATQVMLRATKSKGAYHHLFQQIDENTIRLRESTRMNDEQVNKEIVELKATVSRLISQKALDKVLLGFHEGNFASAAADLLINPNPISIHCTEGGKGYDCKVSIMDIIAIQSLGRTKSIYLKQAVIPEDGGKKRLKIETNENFDILLKRLQGSGNHIIRASDKYAVNIYHYELTQKGMFKLIIDLPQINENLKSIQTEKKFDRELYHTRLMEIDRLSKYHKDITVNLKKIEEISRYKNP